MRPIDTSSLVDRVYEYLLDQIVTGAIKYGDTISIKEIAGQLDVSTMPVREAVKRLEFEQVLTIKPRRSCTVRKPSLTMIREVYEMREVLELYAIERGAPRLGTEEKRRLRTIVEDMRELSTAPDLPAREKKAVALDYEFHACLCAMARNDYLSAYYRQLSLHVNMTLIHEKTYQSLRRQWADIHAEILDAIEHEPARAAEVLRLHFTNVTNLLRSDE